MRQQPTSLLLLLPVALGLAACAIAPFPTSAAAPPTAGDFAAAQPSAPPSAMPGQVSTSSSAGLFTQPLPQPSTPTLYQPQVAFELNDLKAGDEPPVTNRVGQTKNELAVLEARTLVENATFRFDKLSVGDEVGYGRLELGTPTKLAFDLSLRVTDTDHVGTATLSEKGGTLLAQVYLADVQIKQLSGALSIVSIGNATRENAKQGNFTTPASLRVITTFLPGYLKLPTTPGPMRVRTVLLSEPDPTSQVPGQKVVDNTFTIQ